MSTGPAASAHASALAAGATVFSYMLARGVTEGLIDSHRGPTPAEVGQPRR